MISFGHIISEVGYEAKDFPKLSDIPVEIYDRKDRKLEDDENFNFNKRMCKNFDSKRRFRQLLEELSTSSTIPDYISGKLDDSVFVLYIPGRTPEIFLLF